MKKKLLAVISLLVALVMCFTLAACGPKSSDNKNNSGNNSSDDPKDEDLKEVEQLFSKLSNAVNSFYSNEGYKITITGNATSEYTNSEFSESFEREGDWLVNGADDESDPRYYNIKTGYSYTPVYVNAAFAGYVFSSDFALGFTDYFTAAIKNIMQSATVSAKDTAITIPEFVDIAYDEETLTATVKIDVTETVNAFTAPLRTNYASGSLSDVINDYLSLVAPGLTLDTVVDTVKSLAVDNKNTTVGQLADTIGAAVGTDNLSGQLESMLSDYGFEQADITAIMNRTLAEMVMGAMQAVTQEVPAEELAGVIINAAFFAEVDTTGYETVIEQFATAITTMLKGTDFKNTIDPATDFGAFVSGNVEFTDLSAEFTVTFDAQERITAMTFDLGMAHNASAENFAEGSFFSDNDYTLNINFAFSDYIEIVEFEPEIIFYSDPTMMSYFSVIAQSGKDVSAFIELGGIEATDIGEVTVGGYSASGFAEALTPKAGEVVFNKTSRVLTVKSSLIENTELTNLFVDIEVTRNNEPDSMLIYLIETPAAENVTITDLLGFFSKIM